ncbi:Restriction endonuclease [Rhodococcoides kroppenstedtii]|uniref:Restriction endonuclease n=1 Tax=Rhodococcoides kroppenstedtii TaxID=293050 RepID=A0A1I0T1Y2_9NOCA|nr:restriction endonuclease [Rhodococcus kroppenstedtii]SFA45036.1 Restriction endonuclease [Rhodococcus kroppenstedtii]
MGRDQFETIVELLIRRQWDDYANVTVPNGSGGDDGIDINVEKPNQHRRIYQLKYFRDGFSGDKKTTRQKQIRKSYISATKHQPDEWLLVVPTKLTPGEREFVLGLGDPDGPRIEIVDQVELDTLMINFPDVYRYLDRDALRASAILYGQEVAALLGGVTDVVNRVKALGELADTMDLHWGLDFRRVGDHVTYSARPKTADAHLKSPITFTVDGRLGPDDAALRSAMRSTFGFGASDPVLLPAGAVQRLTINGPSFIAGVHHNIEMQFNPISSNPNIGAAAQLTFESPTGSMLGQFEGEVTHIGHGAEGGSLELAFNDRHLELRIMFPLAEESSDPVDVRVGYSLQKIRPHDAVEVLSVNEMLRSPDLVLKVALEDQHLLTVQQQDPGMTPPLDPDVPIIKAIAEDLLVVQSHCKQSFQLPLTVTQNERIDLRVARLLVEGHAVESPAIANVTGVLSGSDSPELRTMLSDISCPRFPLEYEFTIGRKTMNIGAVFVSDPETSVLNPAVAIEHLDRGTAEGVQITFVPGSTAYFRAVLVERAQDRHFVDPPTRWNLEGITQPIKS